MRAQPTVSRAVDVVDVADVVDVVNQDVELGGELGNTWVVGSSNSYCNPRAMPSSSSSLLQR